jgi:DnaJ-domain-containing protein 1
VRVVVLDLTSATMVALHTADRVPACEGCGADEPGSSLVCTGCGRLRPEPGGSSLFGRLGLDPFQAFDAESAELRLLQLSRALHPDHQPADDSDGQLLAVQNLALLNEAWDILRDDQRRGEYLLSLVDPEALERHKNLAPAFLMEAMELSEELETARSEGCGKTIARIAGDAPSAPDVADLPSRPLTLWHTEQVATLLHQARVFRRILRDTES